MSVSGAADSASRWREVWERKGAPSDETTLGALLAADGYDSGFAGLDEQSWLEFVDRRAQELGITGDSSVFEVGCGAGAFLFELHRRGAAVGGLDFSASLINVARRAMSEGSFHVQEAADLAVEPSADVVVAVGVLLYFPSLDYASRVIDLMATKATRAVGVFDVPDVAKQAEALEYRRGSLGDDEYAERYDGLDHLYYDRDWIAERLKECGLERVTVRDQDLANYGNSPFRFNAWGFKP